MPPLSFTDDQIAQLKKVASMLPINARDGFLRSVGNRLVDLPYSPTSADVQAAIDFVLSCRGVAGGVEAFSNINKSVDKGVARARADRCFRTGVSR